MYQELETLDAVLPLKVTWQEICLRNYETNNLCESPLHRKNGILNHSWTIC